MIKGLEFAVYVILAFSILYLIGRLIQAYLIYRKRKKSLVKVVWPDCFNGCEAVEHLGVGECESICPDKFDKEFK